MSDDDDAENVELLEQTSPNHPALEHAAKHTMKITAPPLGLPDDDDISHAIGMLELDTNEFPIIPLDDDSGQVEALRLPIEEAEDGEGLDAWTRNGEPTYDATTETRAALSSPPVARKLGPPKTREKDDALKLVDRGGGDSGPVDLRSELVERFALGNFTGALQVAELLLGSQPDDAITMSYAERCRERLEQIYSSRLGGMGRVPEVAIVVTEIPWLGLDSDSEAMLALVDGALTYQAMVERSGLDLLTACKALVQLVDLGVIST